MNAEHGEENVQVKVHTVDELCNKLRQQQGVCVVIF